MDPEMQGRDERWGMRVDTGTHNCSLFISHSLSLSSFSSLLSPFQTPILGYSFLILKTQLSFEHWQSIADSQPARQTRFTPSMDYYQQPRPQQASAAAPAPGYVYSQSANSTQMYYPQAMTTGHHHQQQPNAYAQPHYAMPTAGNAPTGIDYGTHFGAQAQNSMSAHGQANMNANAQRRPRGMQTTGAELQMHAPAPTPNNAQELPLRLIVDARHVGAIIGSGGSNIKEMSKDTKARITVDSHKSTRDGHGEKIVQIIGAPENITRACVRVLEVVQKELEKDENKESSGEVELKLRAANQLVGRLIGKQGATIKKIMQETGTNIFVSNEQQSRSEMGVLSPYEVALNLERTITVKGPSIDAVSQAESRISQKLRQSFETDLQQRVSGLRGQTEMRRGIQMQLGIGAAASGLPMLPGGMINPFSMDLAALSLAGRTGIMTQPHLGLAAAGLPSTNSNSNATKTLRMYVPNNMVGAIIGSKGTHIRNIMRNSGANVRVDGGGEKKEKDATVGGGKEEGSGEAAPAAPSKDSAATPPAQDTSNADQTKDSKTMNVTDSDKKPEDERLITITGTDIQVQRAQFFIFTRIAEQTGQLFEEVKLRSEVTVPSKLVGRIIGKGGQNVRELQRLTGASVKIPDEEVKNTAGNGEEEKKETAAGDASPNPTETNTAEKKEHAQKEEGTLVRIIGSYPATHHVQARIAQLAIEFNKMNMESTPGKRSAAGTNQAAGDNAGLKKSCYFKAKTFNVGRNINSTDSSSATLRTPRMAQIELAPALIRSPIPTQFPHSTFCTAFSIVIFIFDIIK
ncbi:hypothetical protein WR25_06856 isoform A [Diploscapter pachys]|uniref:K Homology domain-containing protein n=1 Tax=Diploscapter pachys TaxID=2018661 RepID=A0A2A2L5D2_9BILA|nr:hypothetical protein WR25_06856 isoform A [Diploscapter pachys]